MYEYMENKQVDLLLLLYYYLILLVRHWKGYTEDVSL